MKKLVLPHEMAHMDSRFTQETGLPGLLLMERAALGVAQAAEALAAHKHCVAVCGPGNNGGDGLAAARILKTRGWTVEVWMASGPDHLGADAQTQLNAWQSLGGKVRWIAQEGMPPAPAAGIILDALLGTGANRPPEGTLALLIEWMNRTGLPIIAVDIPSGVDGNTGHVLGMAVNADITITFAFPKVGHLLFPGRDYVGTLEVWDIGLPGTFAGLVDRYMLEECDPAQCLAKRPANCHKGTFGHVGILAGSRGMTGAGRLAALAALRTGAGLVTWGYPASEPIQPPAEAMTWPLTAHKGRISGQDAELQEFLHGKTVLAIGPGLGRGPETDDMARRLALAADMPVVWDADALYALGNWRGWEEGEGVLTPHPGEMARLTGQRIETLLENPVDWAQSLARETRRVVVLKGATTVVASPQGRVGLNTIGNPGMATGGSGDVLTGIIAALIAQGLGCWEAAAIGVTLHGMAGNTALQQKGAMGMVSQDITDALPPTLHKLGL